MTYRDDKVAPELKLQFEDKNGDYVNLSEGESKSFAEPGSVWFWIKLALLFALGGALAGVFFKWVGPFVMDEMLIPLIRWQMKTFSAPVLAVLIFTSVALFPMLLIPSSPSMWMAGMTFGMVYGFLLIFPAVIIGISLPYFIAHLFLYRLQGWIEKYPKEAAILSAAGQGDWFHQFKAVAFIRIAPFPYILYNYCAAATRVKYGPYLLGSLVGMMHELFLAIYTGILIRTLADASVERRGLTPTQIGLNLAGLCLSVITTSMATVYAKEQLKVLQTKDEPVLQ